MEMKLAVENIMYVTPQTGHLNIQSMAHMIWQ
jgi:hypothetical protein